MPKVSVIIPAYNAITYLPETLENLLNQTYDDFEAIVINDGSTDGTFEWVSQIKDARVRSISQANQGLAGARNTGINNAKGEYIAFIDADDLWEPSKLEKQVKILDEHPQVGLVYTWVAYINEKSEPTGRVFQNQAEGYVWKELTQHNIVECGSVAMVRRDCFDSVGLFDRNLGSYVEDWDMWLRIAPNYEFKVIKEPLVYYRQLATGTSKNSEAMARSFQLVIEKAFKNTPTQMQYLKAKSYASANLCLAWKALQSTQKDYKKAAQFRAQALNYYPRALFFHECIRLSIAITLMQLFGDNIYSKLLSFFHALRGGKLIGN